MHYTTGNYSMFVKLICKDTDHLRKVLMEKIQKIEDITRTETFISLQESIQLALQHNLGLQIERLSPQIARFDLAGAYSYYDPAFTFRGEQNYRASPGGFNSTINVQTPPNDTWTEHFNAGVGGYTPTGMRYDLAADLTRTSGTFPSGTNSSGGFNIVDRGYQYRPDVGLTFTQPLLRNSWTDASRTAIKINKQLVFLHIAYIIKFIHRHNCTNSIIK